MSAYPTPNAPAPASYGAKPATSYQGALKWAVLGFFVFIVLFTGLAFLGLAGVELGFVGLIVSMITSILPVPIYIALVLWIDRMEAEPAWLLAAGLIWGASVAILFAYIFNSLVGWGLGVVTGSEQVAAVGGAVISAPFSEELGKGSFIFALYFFLRKEFDGVIDGIVYASMVGLGFAMAENFLYHGRTFSQGGLPALMKIFGLRNILSPFAHPLFTSLTGIGLGYACSAKSKVVKFLAPIAGLFGAMCMHGLWNLLASFNLFFLGYILVFVPAFIILFAIALYSIYREQLIVRKQLTPELESGVLSQDEYETIGSAWQRIVKGYHVLTKRGFGGLLASRRFNQAASELAFLRHRIENGVTADPALEADFLATIAAQRVRMQ